MGSSQDIVKQILKELGGRGTLQEIIEYGVKHYPDRITGDRRQVSPVLKRIREWKEIKRGERANEWVLVN